MSRPSPMAQAATTRALEEGFSLDHGEVALMMGASLASLLATAATQAVVIAPCGQDESPPSSGSPTKWA